MGAVQGRTASRVEPLHTPFPWLPKPSPVSAAAKLSILVLAEMSCLTCQGQRASFKAHLSKGCSIGFMVRWAELCDAKCPYLEALIAIIGARHIGYSAQELLLCFVISLQVILYLVVEIAV